MSNHRYFASGEKDEVQLSRLRLLERIFVPMTIRHPEMIGLPKAVIALRLALEAGFKVTRTEPHKRGGSQHFFNDYKHQA